MHPPEALRNRHGHRIDFTWHAGHPDAPRLCLIAHGVTSHKDRPWLEALADGLASAGVHCLRFTFPGNGNSEGRYEDITVTRETEDLADILTALDRTHSGARVMYAGHSMGAAVGVLRAAVDPRITALISLAGITHLHAFMQRTFGHLTPGRDCKLDKPGCPLTQSFLDDAAAIHDTLAAAARIRVPWLLVHGTADELVPLADSHDAVQAATTPTPPTLVELRGADHRFAGHIDAMVTSVVAWAHTLAV